MVDKNEKQIEEAQEKEQIIDEGIIHDFLVCEPVTEKGQISLKRLNLEDKITESYFYAQLAVQPHYVSSKTNEETDYGKLFYQYSLGPIQLEEIRNNNKEFEKRLVDNEIDGYPLLILGVAGNGKTIDVFRRIHKAKERKELSETGVVYINLESDATEINYGNDYVCEENPISLYGLKLFECIMEYLRSSANNIDTIKKNYAEKFQVNNIVNEFSEELFGYIGKYSSGNTKSETQVFNCIKRKIKEIGPEESMGQLLKTLMVIMYCAHPDQKKYIYIDNIEEYVKMNAVNIHIPNSDIAKIYRSVKRTVNNITTSFNRIKRNLGWETFKIVLAMRRTSFAILEPPNLHTVADRNQNVTDVTGQIQLHDIWKEKMEKLWKPFLASKYTGASNEQILKIMEGIMEDGEKKTGIGYQLLIAPLMSYGLRRNARAQSFAIIQTYKYLTENNKYTIDYNYYDKLMNNPTGGGREARYFFRRALIEIQFKWAATPPQHGTNIISHRWQDLNLGYPSEETREVTQYSIVEHVVKYNSPGFLSLVRRILSSLTYEPERNITDAQQNGRTKLFNEMFPTISLYQLVNRVLDTPQHRTIEKIEYTEMARVLLSLGDMANGDTKSAPYLVLNINDKIFQSHPSAESLGDLLHRIKEDGDHSQKYPEEEYCVRITDAGYAFVVDWQYSFTFFAAIYCYTCPPLFFLKNVEIIKYVIDTVYRGAKEVCQKYREEAESFCLPNFNMVSGTYLPLHNGKYTAFYERVQDYHTSHLNLYRNYIRDH